MGSPGPKSMTGFAEARGEYKGCTIRLSLRAVNHRFLDIHVRLPEGYESFEPVIRQLIRERVRRGHVDVTLRVEPTGGAAVLVNQVVATAYLQAANELRQKFGMAGEPDLAALLRLPGVIGAAGTPADGDLEQLGGTVVACLKESLERLDRMRISEGVALAEEMAARLQRIRQTLDRIAALAEKLRPAYLQWLQMRVGELLGAAPVDAARLAQEAAVLAERADISEEILRLRSHTRQFEQLLGTPGDAGKKLDFLLQEMQREANTMLAKTPGVASDGLTITELALEVKSEIERLREQVQNVE